MTVATVFIFHNSKLPNPPSSCARSEIVLLQLELCIKCGLLVLYFFFFQWLPFIILRRTALLKKQFSILSFNCMTKMLWVSSWSFSTVKPFCQWDKLKCYFLMDTWELLAFLYFWQFFLGLAPLVFCEFWRVLVFPTFTFILTWYFTCG